MLLLLIYVYIYELINDSLPQTEKDSPYPKSVS